MFGSTANRLRRVAVLPKESCVFLPLIEKQKDYLIAKGYFPQGTTLSDDDRDMLACSNFRYLLG